MVTEPSPAQESPIVSSSASSVETRPTFWRAERRALISLLMALIAGGVLYGAMRWGPWAFSDSVAYVDAARGLLAGRGLVVRETPDHWVPLAHYPPLYPLLLAALMRLTGASWLAVARGLDALAYGLFVGLIAWAGGRAWPRRPWWGWLVAGVLALQPALVQHMSGVMTEPLFLAFGVVAWAAAWVWLQTRARAAWYVAVSAAVLGLLLRYAGLFYLAALPLVVLLLPRSAWLRAWPRVAEAWAALLGAYASWSLYMRTHGNGLHFAWPTLAEVGAKARDILKALPPVFWVGWLRWHTGLKMPASALWPWLLVGASVVLAIGLWIWLLRHPRHPAVPAAQAAVLAWGFGHTYAAFFFVAYLLRRPEPDFNPRVMLPWLVFGLLGAGFALIAALQAWGPRLSRGRRGLIYGVLLLAMVVFLRRSWQLSRIWIHLLYERGAGYTERRWQEASTWAYLRTWPDAVPWLTNAPEPLLLWADRPAYRLAEFQEPQTVDGPLGARAATDRRHRWFAKGRAAAIYVRPEESRVRRLYGARADEVVDLLFRRYSPCYEDDLIEVYYFGPRAQALCPLGPSEYHPPRR